MNRIIEFLKGYWVCKIVLMPLEWSGRLAEDFPNSVVEDFKRTLSENENSRRVSFYMAVFSLIVNICEKEFRYLQITHI